MSIFESIELLPEDPILGLPALFEADARPNKVNLGIGAYKDSQGLSTVLSSVRKAETLIFEKKLHKEYLPIEGLASYTNALTKLVFGESLSSRAADCMFSMQTVGGTNALRIIADFFSKNGLKNIYIPDPTWPNHHLIFDYGNMKIHTYPYYDPKNHRVDFANMYRALKQLPPKSIVLLHASCHNPTGADLTDSQWKELSHLFAEHQLIPFFDLAYQGFGNGLDEDAFSVRTFLEDGHELFLATSCSKNFGLYGERVGMLTVAAANPEATQKIKSQIKKNVRSSFSVPPLHGVRIVSTILESPELTNEWKQELAAMRNRIKEMRLALLNGLSAKKPEKDMRFLETQKGIFSFIGLTKEEVMQLRKEKGIYMPMNGRINIAGLNQNNIDYVVSSITTL